MLGNYANVYKAQRKEKITGRRKSKGNKKEQEEVSKAEAEEVARAVKFLNIEVDSLKSTLLKQKEETTQMKVKLDQFKQNVLELKKKNKVKDNTIKVLKKKLKFGMLE